jgi:hypothetical protein
MRYVFTRNLVVDTPKGNRAFQAGDEIDGKEILPGCLQSCLQNRSLAVPEPKKPASKQTKKKDNETPALPAAAAGDAAE